MRTAPRVLRLSTLPISHYCEKARRSDASVVYGAYVSSSASTGAGNAHT
jgi:hypothetical protein